MSHDQAQRRGLGPTTPGLEPVPVGGAARQQRRAGQRAAGRRAGLVTKLLTGRVAGATVEPVALEPTPQENTMPRTIELNIGLHVAGQDNSTTRRNARAIRALAELAVRGATLLRQRREVATYQDQAGETRVEETLVVEILDEAWLRRKPSPFYAISEACGQDCIAVYWPHVNVGELVGPRAEEWGAFEPQYFIRFDRVAAATAA